MNLLSLSAAKRPKMAAAGFIALAALFLAGPGTANYVQTNLVSNVLGLATYTDPNLINPWGISSSATSPFWVSNNGTGTSTLYNSLGLPNSLVVTLPPLPSGAPATPTGQVFNGGSSFALSNNQPARFIFATEAGTIAGWNASTATNAVTVVDNAASGAVYKGLASGNNGAGDFLYAANFSAGKIDVFNSTFAPVSLAGGFTDPNVPAGYAPFNIQNLGGTLFVTYALQDGTGHDDEAGAGHGYIDQFDLNGNLLQRLVSGGPLNSPWGLAIAPSSFGEFSNNLLVGNFGDGMINAFNPLTGAFLGQLLNPLSNPITIDGLWGLRFGNGGNGGATNTLYFTAGPNDETDGLFGSLASVPEPATLALLGLSLAGLAASRRRTLN